MIHWLKKVLGLSSPHPPRGRKTHGQAAVSRTPPLPPLPSEPPAAVTGTPAARPASGVGNLDRDEHVTVVLECAEEDLLWNIGRRIERGDLDLPQLPSTSLAAIEMTRQPAADVAELVELISSDPLLCSELLKTANSALYAARIPADTLYDAVMRLGLRALRSMIFSVSVRGVILKGNGLREYAEEVWRQALSVAGVARAISGEARLDREHAFMVGLLQDIGKVSLLAMVRDEVERTSDITPALVGRVFHTFHEKAGSAMAKTWKLSPELVAVAGGHHDYASNEEHGRTAAFAFLAHQLDLYQSLQDESGFHALVDSDVMEYLQFEDDARRRVVDHARRAYESGVAAGAELALAG
jgi:HD-like signal output (HDOD) protein